ncbi:hypothetical protein LXL04_039619 [Taraxacum kok-saghyz]
MEISEGRKKKENLPKEEVEILETCNNDPPPARYNLGAIVMGQDPEWYTRIPDLRLIARILSAGDYYHLPRFCACDPSKDPRLSLLNPHLWGVVVKITVNGVIKFGHLMMTDLYTLIPHHLQMLKHKIFAQKRNLKQYRKAVYDRIVWYEVVCSKILTFNNFMKEHEENHWIKKSTQAKQVARGAKTGTGSRVTCSQKAKYTKGAKNSCPNYPYT